MLLVMFAILAFKLVYAELHQFTKTAAVVFLLPAGVPVCIPVSADDCFFTRFSGSNNFLRAATTADGTPC